MGFNAIIGHERQKQMLLSLLKRQRLPHAFLFTGPDGIGKQKTAREFAKHILCDRHTGCGACRPCIKIDRDSHPDVLIIESETSIGIDQSRGIGREVYEHPYESEMRIIIIDRADTMTHEAVNALLKTLEEPPPFNTFFLITSSEKDIPLTVRSRCARIGFSPLSKESLKQYFQDSLKVDEEKAELISHISQGSIGHGLFWINADNLLFRRSLAELIIGKKKSFLQATCMAERITQRPQEMTILLSFLLSLFRDISILREGREASMIINRDIRELLDAAPVHKKWIDASIRKIQETLGILRYNINKLLAVETLLIHIMEQA